MNAHWLSGTSNFILTLPSFIPKQTGYFIGNISVWWILPDTGKTFSPSNKSMQHTVSFSLFFLFATWLLFMNRIFIFVFSCNPRNAGYHSHLITHGSIQIFSFILFHFFPSFATYFTTHGSIQKNFIPRYSFIQKWVSQTTIFPYRPTVLVFPLDIRYFEYLWANFFRIDPRLLVFHLIFTISSITILTMIHLC